MRPAGRGGRRRPPPCPSGWRAQSNVPPFAQTPTPIHRAWNDERTARLRQEAEASRLGGRGAQPLRLLRARRQRGVAALHRGAAGGQEGGGGGRPPRAGEAGGAAAGPCSLPSVWGWRMWGVQAQPPARARRLKAPSPLPPLPAGARGPVRGQGVWQRACRAHRRAHGGAAPRAAGAATGGRAAALRSSGPSNSALPCVPCSLLFWDRLLRSFITAAMP